MSVSVIMIFLKVTTDCSSKRAQGEMKHSPQAGEGAPSTQQLPELLTSPIVLPWVSLGGHWIRRPLWLVMSLGSCVGGWSCGHRTEYSGYVL